MKKIIVFGATGTLGKYVVEELEKVSQLNITLYIRNKSKLTARQQSSHSIVEGDVMDYSKVESAIKGQDIVYFGLSGKIDEQIEVVLKAMKATGVKRIIAISSMGIYGASWKATLKGGKNAPGLYNSIMLTLMKPLFPRYRRLSEKVETSGLDYTVLRPGKFTYEEEVNYHITYKGQPESGRDISRRSIAVFVARVAAEPNTFICQNVGLSRENK